VPHTDCTQRDPTTRHIHTTPSLVDDAAAECRRDGVLSSAGTAISGVSIPHSSHLNLNIRGETMSGYEDMRFHLRASLAQHIGDEPAARLMEALPPYNWTDIVTKNDLKAEMAQVRLEIAGLRAEIHSLMRTQLIQMTTIFSIINASMVAVLQFGR